MVRVEDEDEVRRTKRQSLYQTSEYEKQLDESLQADKKEMAEGKLQGKKVRKISTKDSVESKIFLDNRKTQNKDD